MASKGVASSSSAILLSLNLFFFAYVQAVPSQKGACPIDTLKLGVCANVLHLVKVKVGSPPTLPCCSLIEGLPNLEAVACLCTALKANVLGIKLNVPVSLSVILNNCGKNNSGFQCS